MHLLAISTDQLWDPLWKKTKNNALTHIPCSPCNNTHTNINWIPFKTGGRGVEWYIPMWALCRQQWLSLLQKLLPQSVLSWLVFSASHRTQNNNNNNKRSFKCYTAIIKKGLLTAATSSRKRSLRYLSTRQVLPTSCWPGHKRLRCKSECGNQNTNLFFDLLPKKTIFKSTFDISTRGHFVLTGPLFVCLCASLFFCVSAKQRPRCCVLVSSQHNVNIFIEKKWFPHHSRSFRTNEWCRQLNREWNFIIAFL